MNERRWVALPVEDVAVIREALSVLRSVSLGRVGEIDRLDKLLEDSSPTAITVGVYGGLVQWVQGNPHPIRIIDYDGDEGDLPDRDDEGLPCAIRHVERDPDLIPAQV